MIYLFTFGNGNDGPDLDRSVATELAQDHLQEIERFSDQK